MAASFSKSRVHIFLLSDPDYHCCIDETAGGLIGAQWAPSPTQPAGSSVPATAATVSSPHVITTADHHVRLTVWDLRPQPLATIRFPKFAQQRSFPIVTVMY